MDKKELKEKLELFLGLSAILSNISDMEELFRLKNKVDGFNDEKLVYHRMAEVLKNQLPTISDMEKLIGWWKKLLPSEEPKKVIESRMIEILAEVNMENIPTWFISLLDDNSSAHFPLSFSSSLFLNAFHEKAYSFYLNL